MSYANIVHNNSPTRHGVVSAFGSGSKKMMYCIFQKNHDYLFYVEEGSFEVTHSFIDFLSVKSTPITTVVNNSYTKIPTYRVQFFKSHFCNADIPLKTSLKIIERTPIITQSPTFIMTKINTPPLTPYRSYGEQSPHYTHFPVHTPHQSLFPIQTMYRTHYPERTNQRSFPLDFDEKTQKISHEESNMNVDESKSNTVFMYSSICLFVLIVVIISYNIGSEKNQKHDSTSSSSTKKTHYKEENYNEYNINRDQQCNYDSICNPYTFSST